MRLSKLVLYTEAEVFEALLKKHKIERTGVIDTGHDPSWLQKTTKKQDRWDIIIEGGQNDIWRNAKNEKMCI